MVIINIGYIEYSQLLPSCSQWWRWHTAEEVSQSSDCSPCGIITKVRLHAHNRHRHVAPWHRGMLPRPLLRASLASLCDRHSGVMGGPGKAVAGVWEANAMHPTTASNCSLTCSSRTTWLKQHLPEWHLAAPGSGAGLLLHLLNVGWKHPVASKRDRDATQGREKETKQWLIYTGRRTFMNHLICAVFVCFFMKISIIKWWHLCCDWTLEFRLG